MDLPRARRRRAAAFTLAETLMAMAVLALVVAALAQAVTAGHAQADASLRAMRAVLLADGLLEEVLAHPYADPQGTVGNGPDAGETRATFDNLDDYHGLVEQPAALRDAANALLPSEYQAFRRTVTTAYTTAPGPGGTSLAGLLITVNVTDPAGRAWTVRRFVAQP